MFDLVRKLKTVSISRIEGLLSSRILGHDLSELVILVAILIYTLVFSYYTILKYDTFRAYAWDLGIFNQALWTTTHEGRLFYYTVELYVNPGGNFFGSHFSPILFLVLPIHFLYPRPEVLLSLQSFVLALGALPLYFFARDALNHRTAAVAFSLAYLGYPPLHGVNWFDFHVQAFLPVFFLSAMYFLRKEKWSLYFVFIFMSLCVAENVPLVVLFIGFYCLWTYRKPVLQTFKEKTLIDKRVLIPILTIIVAVVWIILALWIQRTYFPIDSAYLSLYKAVSNWTVLGLQDDPIKLPLYAITHPAKVVEALAYDTYLKLFYVILLFGPLQFASIRSARIAIAFVWLGPIFLSNYTPYYMIGNQYPAYVIAFIFLAAVDSIGNKVAKTNGNALNSYTKNMLILAFLFLIFISPLSPLLTTFRSTPPAFSDYYPPSMSRHDAMLHTMVNLVPRTASVLTQNNIFPHFSDRSNAFVYPVTVVLDQSSPDKMDLYLDRLMQNSDFILVDSVSDPSTAELAIDKITSSRSYGQYAFADGIYLFKKDYHGPMVLYVPEE